MLLNRRFDYRPAVIVACATDKDVGVTIRFARTQELAIAIRAGGCSPGGLSSNNGGLLLDLSMFNDITVDATKQQARIGAGVLLQDVITKLEPTGLMVPVGECLPVGFSGLALGGGFGLLSRSIGLTCDNILEATVVTALGVAITASEEQNPDLFWALRGAGGGNFGVVTSLTARLHPIPPAVAVAQVTWPIAQGTQVLPEALGYFANQAPDQLNAVFSMLPMPAGGRVLGTLGMYNGPPDKGKELLGFFTKLGTPSQSKMMTVSYSKLLLGIPNQATTIHDYYKSGFVTGVLPDAAIDTLVDRYATTPEHLPGIENMVAFELAGGAINRVAPTDTAFVHRRHTLLLSIVASWTGPPGGQDRPETGWADALYKELTPYYSGEVYQNYPDLELPDPARAYYGENLDRLRRIKRQFDPENVFHSSQGILPT